MYGLNLIGIQRKVRKLDSPSKLFQLWEAICHLHESGRINGHELDEIQMAICAQFRKLDTVQGHRVHHMQLRQRIRRLQKTG